MSSLKLLWYSYNLVRKGVISLGFLSVIHLHEKASHLFLRSELGSPRLDFHKKRKQMKASAFFCARFNCAFFPPLTQETRDILSTEKKILADKMFSKEVDIKIWKKLF